MAVSGPPPVVRSPVVGLHPVAELRPNLHLLAGDRADDANAVERGELRTASRQRERLEDGGVVTNDILPGAAHCPEHIGHLGARHKDRVARPQRDVL